MKTPTLTVLGTTGGATLVLAASLASSLADRLDWGWYWTPAEYSAGPRDEIELRITMYNEPTSDRPYSLMDGGMTTLTGHLFNYYEFQWPPAGTDFYDLLLADPLLLEPGESVELIYGTLVPVPRLAGWSEGLGANIVFAGPPWIEESLLRGRPSDNTLQVTVTVAAVPAAEPAGLLLGLGVGLLWLCRRDLPPKR